MTSNDCKKEIKKLKGILNKENAEVINEKLDKLFKFKPVPLEWFILKAETMKLLGIDTSEIDYLLYRKYNMIIDSEKVSEIINYFLSNPDINNSAVEEQKFKFQICSMHNFYKKADDEETRYYNEIINKSNLLMEKFVGSEEISLEVLEDIIDILYIQQDHVSCIIFDKLYQKLFNKETKLNEYCRDWNNSQYLDERLDSQNRELFIFLSNNETRQNCLAAAKAAAALNRIVFVIDPPLNIEADNKPDLAETVKISLSNAYETSNIMIIPSIELICDNEICADNRSYIINYLNSNYSENNLSTVISSGYTIDKMCRHNLLNKYMERLDIFRSRYFEKNMSVAWCGSYLSYISNIYMFNTEEAVEQSAEYDFSIVIPARNSSETLKYTVKTCLDIDYDGSYEIVISDNSSNGNHEVFDFVQQLNDKRINYYKTPRELQLSKSFEFAFLKSKGKFIIALGSDDGILPWSLKILKKILEEVNDQIISWHRGFYAWPGFNYGQQNEFIIPGRYINGNVNGEYIKNTELFARICYDPQQMYGLPLLYINSGFRREYLKTLLSKTGRLWDGPCQDLYMGIINIIINDKILDIEYPITIAGMAGNSAGFNDNVSNLSIENSNKTYKKYKGISVGCETQSYYERLIPNLSHDRVVLYRNIFRAVSRGLLTKEFVISNFELETIYKNMAAQIRKTDIMSEEYIYSLRYSASLCGREFLDWFDEFIYPQLNTLVAEDKKPDYKRCYKIGVTENGGLHLDASDFNVKNIADAVDLFRKITGLD